MKEKRTKTKIKKEEADISLIKSGKRKAEGGKAKYTDEAHEV